MGLIHQIFYACLKLQFPDVETNPGLRVLYLLLAEYCVVMYGAYLGTLVT